MFGKHHRFGRLAGTLVVVAVLLPVAQAGAQASSTGDWGEYGMPRAMPSDYAAYFATQIQPGDYGMPRAMPSDYAAYFARQLEPGDYGMPRPLPADYSPVGSPSTGSGFDWADAGIGAGAAFGLVLLALAAALTLRGGRRLKRA